MPGTATVECCLRNVGPKTYQQLRSSDIEVDYQHCLMRCGYCRQYDFLVVDGDPHCGPHERLLASLEAADG